MDEASKSGGAVDSVFLSYTRDDRSRALPIIEALEARGIDVWWDGLLKGGERFASTTETALETSNAVIVLWSAKSIESHWVRDEATRGRDRGCMVSVSLDGTEPPLGFRQIQYIDFSGWRGDDSASQFLELIGAVGIVSDAPGTQLSYANKINPSRGISRRTALYVAGGSVVAIGGALAALRTGIFGDKATSNSIAVMAFENLSPDPEQAYFSDGLTEELRTTLSLNPQLDVMAQASSNSFKGKSTSAQEIADVLNVSSILEGSVQRSGNRVRITASLIDGADGFESWSKSFERDFNDILDVQREIATEVVDSLLANLLAETKLTERIGGTKDPNALDAFLQGSALYYLAKDEESDRAALTWFEEAKRIDPEYAAAFAALSRANTVIANFYASGKELLTYYDRAMEHARRAIELSPELAEGHSALGFALTYGKLDLVAARGPYMRSFELGFGNADILSSFANFASNVAEFDDGRKAIARAQRLDPLNANVYRNAAILEFAARDFDAARRAARSALSYNSEISTAYRLIGDIDLLEGNVERADENYRKEPSKLTRLRGLAITQHAIEGTKADNTAFNQMVDEYGENSLYQQAQIFAQWSEPDRAIEALNRGFEVGDSGLTLAPTDPLLDPIRQDPRFRAIISRLGMN